MTAVKFTMLQLHENLLKGIAEAGFSHCMQVQEETLKHTLKGVDVSVQSQTGTGKTAAFLISIFQLLLNDESLSKKKALVIAPTRELAIQIETEAKLLGRYLDFNIGCLYGGVGYEKQEKLLSNNADIIIGTPGRMIDFYRQDKLHFNDIGILVIDEADRMFDMGFLPDVRSMVKEMPSADQRVTMLFSATLDNRVREIAWEYMNEPVEIKIESNQVTVENITQELYHVSREEKMSLLLGILNKEKPANALIFTNTKHAAVDVAGRLKGNGYPCEFIMGDLPQSTRSKIIDDTKAGKIQFLVATDVAARGLHINDLELVVNYDLPSNCENYVHRIGRTARAGKSGKSITLACDRYVFELAAIEEFINMKIPVSWATEDLFFKDKSVRKSFAGKKQTLKEGHYKGDSVKQPVAGKASSRKSIASKKPAQIKTIDKSKPDVKKPVQIKKQPKKFIRKHSAPKSSTREKRMDYYREKYGENFTSPTDSPSLVLHPAPGESVRKQSLFQRIVGHFTGN